MNENTIKMELRLDEGGLWAVRSTSSTVCYLDLDKGRLLRQRGPGSSPMPYDGLWVALVEVKSPRGDAGVIRVGDRHEFLTDPQGGARDYRWWIPRTCTAIEPIDREDLPDSNDEWHAH